MNTIDTRDNARRDPYELPRFELEYLVDDLDEPTEIMVVPEPDHSRGHEQWITMDTGHAVPLEDVR